MFLTQDDFKTVIKDDHLSKITDSDPSTLDEAIRVAVGELTSYLSNRYDAATALALTGVNRNSFLVLRCVDLALYHLYSRVSPRNIPDLRRDRYTECIDWLKMINKGTAVLNIPLLPVDNQPGYIVWGGNKPFRFR